MRAGRSVFEWPRNNCRRGKEFNISVGDNRGFHPRTWRIFFHVFTGRDGQKTYGRVRTPSLSRFIAPTTRHTRAACNVLLAGVPGHDKAVYVAEPYIIVYYYVVNRVALDEKR